MATPFLYYGQDTGSVYYYHERVLLGFQGLNYYVILRDSDGNPYLTYDRALPQVYSPQEQLNYDVNFGGDFFGSNDTPIYDLKFASGEVRKAYSEVGYFEYNPTGIVSGIPLDLPKIILNITGNIQSGLNDYPKYNFVLNSGVVTGILYDFPVYNFAITGLVTGAVIDRSKYDISFSGKVKKIYSQKENIRFDFFGGSCGRGSVLFYISGQDKVNLGFNFSDGAIGGAS